MNQEYIKGCLKWWQLVCQGVATIASKARYLGGLGACPSQGNLDFRPSDIISGAVSGQNSHQKLAISLRPGDYLPLKDWATLGCWEKSRIA